jgi:putative phosphoribosyl transferase
MFRDRKDGGERLARALEAYSGKDVLVLGIPRGGVETAFFVAKQLQAQLSFVVTRKLAYPHNPEAAFGALTEDGSIFIFREAQGKLSANTIQKIVEREQNEIARRIKVLRRGQPLPPIQGRTVIIVDDGVATGATLFATIELCKKQKVGKIIVAAPVSDDHMALLLETKVDEVVILSTPPFYYAVSQGYQNFSNLTDEDVRKVLEEWEHDKSLNPT